MDVTDWYSAGGCGLYLLRVRPRVDRGPRPGCAGCAGCAEVHSRADGCYGQLSTLARAIQGRDEETGRGCYERHAGPVEEKGYQGMGEGKRDLKDAKSFTLSTCHDRKCCRPKHCALQ